ncbi:MAG: hypothetical protein HY982_01795 [Candidatus Magasanikbacteria bacterium]|nr:hypothetical protein [Candidatus Magasanikbacteria bacterium]
MGTRDSIKVLNGALDEVNLGEGEEKEIILRGVIDPDSLHLLQVGDYQREIMPLSTINDLERAYEEGASVPDIDCGVRGWGYDTRSGCFYLSDMVFIIDGQQRVTAALRMLQKILYVNFCYPQLLR